MEGSLLSYALLLVITLMTNVIGAIWLQITIRYELLLIVPMDPITLTIHMSIIVIGDVTIHQCLTLLLITTLWNGLSLNSPS
jgi:hypothetical protein